MQLKMPAEDNNKVFNFKFKQLLLSILFSHDTSKSYFYKNNNLNYNNWFVSDLCKLYLAFKVLQLNFQAFS